MFKFHANIYIFCKVAIINMLTGSTRKKEVALWPKRRNRLHHLCTQRPTHWYDCFQIGISWPFSNFHPPSSQSAMNSILYPFFLFKEVARLWTKWKISPVFLFFFIENYEWHRRDPMSTYSIDRELWMVQERSYGQTNGNFGTKLFAPVMAQVVQGWSGVCCWV